MTGSHESDHLNAPQSRIVHDRLHFSKQLNEAINKILLSEFEEPVNQGKDCLKGSKYYFLLVTRNWSEDYKAIFDMVKGIVVKVAKAWAVKEAFA